MIEQKTELNTEIICLVTSHRSGELIGGVERFVESFSKWLLGNGIRTIIVARRLSFLNPVSTSFNDRSSRPFAVKHIKTVQVPYVGYITYMLSYSLIAALYIIKLNKKYRFSVIHAQDLNFAGLSAIIAGKILNIPVVLHSHGPFIYLIRPKNRIRIIIEINLNKFVAQQADRIIATDIIAKNYLLDIGVAEEKVTIIPTAIKLELFRQKGQNEVSMIRKEIGVSQRDFLLGYVGRLSVEKNVDALIKAFSHALEGNTHGFKLIIIGDGPERMRLFRLAEKCNLDKSVIFTGWRTDVQSLLAAIDVFILPSSIEGVPLSLLEAMASGKAIIASDIPSIRATVRNGEEAILVSPCDVEKLKRAILLLYNNSDLRAKLGWKARERAKLYDVDRVYGQILNVYEELVRCKTKYGTAKKPRNDHDDAKV